MQKKNFRRGRVVPDFPVDGHKYGIMHLSQLPSSSDSFIRCHSDYQWLLTTNKRHLEAPKIG